MFKDKNVLVTGGGGMIGRPLIKILLERGASVFVADISKPYNLDDRVKYFQTDLRYFDNCVNVCRGMDYVFNLVGIKGSPKMSSEQPVDFMVPMLQFNTNMMEAAFRAQVEWYLYTSSVGVYAPAEVFYEDDVWSTFPSPNDKFAGWAKRIGELQAEAYKIQHKWDKISIVRPANVYGPFDNFNPANAMVIPSLIRKVYDSNKLEVWGDGTPIRDFIYAEDVALGMIKMVENKVTQPVNLGSGKPVSIKEVVDLIVKHSKKTIDVIWDKSKPSGDLKRLFDTKRAENFGFTAQTNLSEGIEQTIEWFINNRESIDLRYNAFNHG